MSGDTVVPDDDGVGLPLDTRLVVDTLVDVVVEEVQDGVCGSVDISKSHFMPMAKEY